MSRIKSRKKIFLKKLILMLPHRENVEQSVAMVTLPSLEVLISSAKEVNFGRCQGLSYCVAYNTITKLP